MEFEHPVLSLTNCLQEKEQLYVGYVQVLVPTGQGHFAQCDLNAVEDNGRQWFYLKNKKPLIPFATATQGLFINKDYFGCQARPRLH